MSPVPGWKGVTGTASLGLASAGYTTRPRGGQKCSGFVDAALDGHGLLVDERMPFAIGDSKAPKTDAPRDCACHRLCQCNRREEPQTRMSDFDALSRVV